MKPLLALSIFALLCTSPCAVSQDDPGGLAEQKKRVEEAQRRLKKAQEETRWMRREFADAAMGRPSVRWQLDVLRRERACLRIAMLGYTDLLELDNLRPATRKEILRILRRTWGPDGHGVRGALHGFSYVLCAESDNDAACIAILQAVGHIGWPAARMAKVVKGLDTAGRPKVNRVKRWALKQIDVARDPLDSLREKARAKRPDPAPDKR